MNSIQEKKDDVHQSITFVTRKCLEQLLNNFLWSVPFRCATNADCRLADYQTGRPEDLQTYIFCDRALLCLLLANRKVCLRQTTALAGCKHNSARFDRWLEILAVEDLTSEERWPKLQREQRRRRRVGSSSGFIAEGHLWAGNKSAQNLIVGEFL